MTKDPNRSRWILRLLLAGVVAVAFVSCGDEHGPTTPDALPGSHRLLTQRIDTADITFYLAPGDSVNTAYQQAYHEWAVTYLGISMPQRLRYFKYLDNAHMRELTGQPYGSWADVEGYAVHSVERQQGHEAAHCYSRAIGWPSDFFAEGIACAMDVDPFTGEEVPFFGDTVHNLCRNWLAQGALYPLAGMVENSGFWTGRWTQSYPQAGSFTQFLIAEFGLETWKELFRSIEDDDPRDIILAAFESVYGMPLEEAERRWHGFLRASR